MKKKILLIIGIIIAIVLVVVLIVVNSNKNKSINTEIVDIINNYSILPVKYMTKYDANDITLERYKKIDNYMSKDFSNEEVSFSYYGYPNDESDYYLGSVSIATNSFNILGVTIGDDMKEAVSKVESYGFELKEHNDYFSATLKKDDYTIKIESDIENDDETKDTVGSISISVNSKYLGNRVY